MKNKKGFTLVELIGTFLILAIIMGIVVIAYINIDKALTKAYYDTLEESLLIAGGEYFENNKSLKPVFLGEEKEVSIQKLVDNKYMQDEVKSRKGSSCQGRVSAYKDNYDKINYYVCLSCDDGYKTNTVECNGDIN